MTVTLRGVHETVQRMPGYQHNKGRRQFLHGLAQNPGQFLNP